MTDQDFQSNTWVKVLELPNLFSFEEALLLCLISENKWLTWIPDYGEAVLHTGQFETLTFTTNSNTY